MLNLDATQRETTVKSVKDKLLVDSRHYHETVNYVPKPSTIGSQLSIWDLKDLQNFTDEEKNRLIQRANEITAIGSIVDGGNNIF